MSSQSRCFSALASMMTIGLVLAGCGDKKPGVTPPDGSTPVTTTDGSVRITPAFDECPAVVVAASPASTHIGQTVRLSASVSGKDGGAAPGYHWTATAGRFADASAAATTFTCPGADHAGPAILTLTVSDGSACAVTRTVTIGCLALADAGGNTGLGGATGGDAGGQPDGSATGGAGGALGAGMGGMSGTGGMGGAGVSCTGDPSLCEGALCNQCTFGAQSGEPDLCTDSMSGCFNCVPDTDGCARLPSDSARTKCWAVYACIRDQACMNDGDVTACWCGATMPDKCWSGAQAATGPCLQQFIDAAGSSDPAFINQHIIDPNIALGGAVNLASCRRSFCGKGSDAEHPACPAW